MNISKDKIKMLKLILENDFVSMTSCSTALDPIVIGGKEYAPLRPYSEYIITITIPHEVT